MYILGVPLGFIMRIIYNVLQNYGLTLVVFTVFVKALMIPLAVKQQKSSAKMAAFRPQLEEIQQISNQIPEREKRRNSTKICKKPTEDERGTAKALPKRRLQPYVWLPACVNPVPHYLRFV